MVDRLNKTGSALLMLAGGDDSERLQSLIDDDNTRFDAVKNSARERSNSLDEALQQAAEVTRIYCFHTPTYLPPAYVVCGKVIFSFHLSVCNSICPRGRGVLVRAPPPPRTSSSHTSIGERSVGLRLKGLLCCNICGLEIFNEAEMDVNICSF